MKIKKIFGLEKTFKNFSEKKKSAYFSGWLMVNGCGEKVQDTEPTLANKVHNEIVPDKLLTKRVYEQGTFDFSF
jgi:hypothetical protein